MYVIDEQHRFGVRQRATLDGKAPEGLTPHALHMTATPIPRTLALTAYGDLDTTTLRELPAGRRPIETHVVNGARERARAYERIREEIAKGQAVLRGVPARGGVGALQATAATEEARRLQETEFRDHRVELIHGQMPTARKQAAMAKFAAGEADVLVATSVIEVGIDVPNATVMLIEAAERYGISQLHQLRGRIGRGEHASLCILFGDPTLPRLEAVARERDGFKLAEVDLAIRGAGELLGTRQHGLPEFRVARLPEDVELLQKCARDRRRAAGLGSGARGARARTAAGGGRRALRARARSHPCVARLSPRAELEKTSFERYLSRMAEPRQAIDLRDPRSLRAMAHPTRVALVGALRREGPLTATRAGELIGESASSCSFHLRQLAKYGLVEEAGGGRGRERPWKATAWMTEWPSAPESAELAEAADALTRVVAGFYDEQVRRWLETKRHEPAEWQEAALFGDELLHLTADELKELGERIAALTEKYNVRARRPELRPDGSRSVSLITLGFPSQYPGR